MSVEHLDIGMYIHDINCGWLDHPFISRNFMINDSDQIDKIKKVGLREVYIDTDRSKKTAPVESRPVAEVNSEIEDGFLKLAKTDLSDIQSESPIANFQDELGPAKRIIAESNAIVRNIMADVRLGRQIQVERIDPLVEKISSSIFRNPDALSVLTRIKNKDDYTFLHSVSVCALLISFARYRDLDADKIRAIGQGGLVHDIGKMRVPDHILNKPGPLTDAEFDTIKRHPELGAEILQKTPDIDRIAVDITLYHHERYDGSGYPHKRAGLDIPEVARMAAIVDVYDAMTSNRCYKRKMEPTTALRKIFDWSRNHFDEHLTHLFIRTVGIYPTGTLVRLESGHLAIVTDQDRQDLLSPTVQTIYDINRKSFVTPRVTDLREVGIRIDRAENPERWGIDLSLYI
ncbi:MAG: HD-GYP domain-containing protein [Pseudomonadota bacterium]|nr:HD-GYP domain-containing protein [Pseudomonadota bacterium]